VADPEQDQHAGADPGDALAVDLDRGLADPLDQRPQAILLRTPATLHRAPPAPILPFISTARRNLEPKAREHDPEPSRAAASEWSEEERVSEYLARGIPHRETAEELLLAALPARVGRFLDLGSGDGRLLSLVRERHPAAHGIGLDLSEPMLARAAEWLGGEPGIELRRHDLASPLAEPGPFDAIVSGLAIHHLEDERKRALFAEVQALLGPGGVFANLDLVSSASSRLHERFRREIGRAEDDPSDRLADLGAQLEWLREVGLVEVDCHFKWLELALVVAVKGR
jgi:tRNA (cmo5U34)-methyltransferase